MRLDQTIRNLTCGDLEILLVDSTLVIQMGVTGLKKDLVCVPPGLVFPKVNVSPNIPCGYLFFALQKASAFLQIFFPRNLLFRLVLRALVFSIVNV